MFVLVKILVEQWLEPYGAPKKVHPMKMYASGVILDGVLGALNVHVSTGVLETHMANPLSGVFIVLTQCERSPHTVQKHRVLCGLAAEYAKIQ